MAILSTCEELCDSILASVQVGEFAVVQPLSVEYSCILGYLLAWKLLLTFFKSSPSHVSRSQARLSSASPPVVWFPLVVWVWESLRLPGAGRVQALMFEMSKGCIQLFTTPLVFSAAPRPLCPVS